MSDSYEFLKAQKDEILERQRRELAKRVADECFGEATKEQTERVYRILAKGFVPNSKGEQQ